MILLLPLLYLLLFLEHQLSRKLLVQLLLCLNLIHKDELFRRPQNKKHLLTHHLGLLCWWHRLTPEVWVVHSEEKIDSTILITIYRFQD